MNRKSNGSYDISEAQHSAQIRAMRRDDPEVVEVLLSCSHAALYVLEQGASVHWRKVGIEGFFYLLQRYCSAFLTAL